MLPQNILIILSFCIGVGVTGNNDFHCYNKADGFYTNPLTCAGYFVCTAGQAYSFVCQSGKLYNARTQFCDDAQNVQCHTIPPSTSVPDVHQTAAFCLGRGDNFYPSPGDCDVYIICSNQTTTTVRCPYGLLYDASKKYCNLRSRVSCLPGQRIPSYTTKTLPTPPTQTSRQRITYPPTTSTPRVVIQTSQKTTAAVDLTALCRNQVRALLAVPGICGQYVQCYYQIPMLRLCPSGTAFNVRIQACDFPRNVPGCP